MPGSSDPAAVAPPAGATLDDWLRYLETIHPTTMDLGLDRVLTVYRRLFPRPPRGRIITVAGTNGKGSTVACLEALLQAAGRRVGAYTSPHLNRYNERVRIQGRDASDEALVAAFMQVEEARGNTTLTYFEFGTLAAFLIMARTGVEDWILEVGLGGRLDAVNVMDADLAIITSIAIDHAAWLGDDRDAIGYEKAGILRPGQTAIYAEADPPRSILQQAAAQRVRLSYPGRGYHLANGAEASVQCHGDDEAVILPPTALPLTSQAAAVVATRTLEPALTPRAMTRALTTVAVPGRFEQLASCPDVYVDVGHNPHAAQWLAQRVAALAGPRRRVLAVYGCLEDKDSAGVVTAFAGMVSHWYLAGLAVPRGMSAASLRERVGPALAQTPASTHGDVTDALAAARDEARADDLILVLGSFYTVAAARDRLLGS